MVTNGEFNTIKHGREIDRKKKQMKRMPWDEGPSLCQQQVGLVLRFQT